MRIAFITSHPIQYQAPLFKKIAERIDLKVLFCSDWGITEKRDPGFGVSFKWDIPLLEGYEYSFLKNYGKGNIFGFFGQINPVILGELWKGRYDGAIIHGWNSATAWLAWLAAIVSNTPLFIRGETPFSQEKNKSKFRNFIKRIILRIFFMPMAGFLYIGEENRLFYKSFGIGDNKLYFTPYAVDNDCFRDSFKKYESKRKECRSSAGISDNETVILFVGKLIPKKNPMDLLRAYEKVDFKDKKLIFVGDGELRAKLQDYIKDKKIEGVIFAGFKNQTELPEFYAIADIFVLPSGMGETWGLVVNEAMNFGLPVVVSDMVGSAKDLVHEGENGWTFPLGNVHELKEKLEKLASDENLRSSFGGRSREIIKNYSFEKDVEGIIKAIQ